MVDLTQVIVAFLTLVFSLVSVYLIPLLKSKVSGEQLETIKFWVNIAVEAAEMIYVGKGKGAEKKAYVEKYLSEKGLDRKSTRLNSSHE